MPVVDLRNILGLPATPPENPSFQRTRQLANGTQFENAMALADQATAIRQQRPFAALQAIQNQQDEIAQRAQNLRLQQEAQIAAQQATQGLTGLTPDHPDYMANRQRILQQNPTALLDPQFRNALNVYDEGYDQIAKQRQAQQNQIAAAQRQAHGLALRYITAGGDPNNPKILDAIQNGDSHTIAAEYGKLNMAAKKKAPKDQSLNAYEKIFNLAKDEMKALQEAAPDPEREKIVSANYEKAKADYLSALQGLTPQTAQAVAKGESVVPAPAAEGGSQLTETPEQESQYKRVMAGGNLPSVTASPEQVRAKVDAEINSPTVNEDFLTSLIENHNIPIEQRKKALDKFRAFAVNPPSPPGSTLGDVLARKDKITEQLKRAEKAVRLAPERDRYIQAWNDAKQDTAKEISRFAKSIGADDTTVINSLIKNEIVEIPGRYNPKTENFKWSVRDLFYDDQAKRLGVDVRRLPSLPNERLEPFQKSEFAKELGVESFTLPGFRRVELGSGKKTYDDVLNSYLQEKAGNTPLTQVALPRPSSPEEAAKLPPGTKFIDPNGKIKEVPALK